MNTPKETIEQRFRNIFGNGHVSLLLAVQDKTTIYGEKDIYNFVSSELQGIISDLEDEKIVNSIDAGQFALHTDGYNQALSDAQEIIRRHM